MIKNKKKWNWVLTSAVFEDEEHVTKILGVFSWIGSATGYVKHFTDNEGRKWHSSGEGVLSVWVSEGELEEGFVVYKITPVQVNPFIEKPTTHDSDLTSGGQTKIVPPRPTISR